MYFVCFISSPNIPSSEYQALKDLYISTQGNSWTLRLSSGFSNWHFDSIIQWNPCSEKWQGVMCTCSTSTGSHLGNIYYDDHVDNFTYCNVKKIFLSLSNLQGFLPDSIGNLTELTHFSASKNGLTGSLPTTICNLLKVCYLSIKYKYFCKILNSNNIYFP
jgi:hypothetical protein